MREKRPMDIRFSSKMGLPTRSFILLLVVLYSVRYTHFKSREIRSYISRCALLSTIDVSRFFPLLTWSGFILEFPYSSWRALSPRPAYPYTLILSSSYFPRKFLPARSGRKRKKTWFGNAPCKHSSITKSFLFSSRVGTSRMCARARVYLFRVFSPTISHPKCEKSLRAWNIAGECFNRALFHTLVNIWGSFSPYILFQDECICARVRILGVYTGKKHPQKETMTFAKGHILNHIFLTPRSAISSFIINWNTLFHLYRSLK